MTVWYGRGSEGSVFFAQTPPSALLSGFICLVVWNLCICCLSIEKASMKVSKGNCACATSRTTTVWRVIYTELL